MFDGKEEPIRGWVAWGMGVGEDGGLGGGGTKAWVGGGIGRQGRLWRGRGRRVGEGSK